MCRAQDDRKPVSTTDGEQGGSRGAGRRGGERRERGRRLRATGRRAGGCARAPCLPAVPPCGGTRWLARLLGLVKGPVAENDHRGTFFAAPPLRGPYRPPPRPSIHGLRVENYSIFAALPCWCRFEGPHPENRAGSGSGMSFRASARRGDRTIRTGGASVWSVLQTSVECPSPQCYARRSPASPPPSWNVPLREAPVPLESPCLLCGSDSLRWPSRTFAEAARSTGHSMSAAATGAVSS